MSNISKDWTPLRFQLRMSYSSTSKRTKVELLQTANKAIDSVLDSIAPGQGAFLKKYLISSKISAKTDLFLFFRFRKFLTDLILQMVIKSGPMNT